jgi:predicted dehydrogenase
MDLDLVSIATPPWTHAELAAAALDRGAHVFTEKPMAMNLTEAEGMVAAAARADRSLCVSHNFRFSRAVAKARRFLGPGAEPLYAMGIQVSSLRRRLPDWYANLPGGLLFDEVPHLVYLMHDFLGALEVDHVRARWGTSSSEPLSAEVLLRGERGPGQITMVFDAPVSEWQMMITTSRGVVLLDLFRDICVRIRPDGVHGPLDILRTSAKGLSDHGAGFVGSGVRYVAGRQRWGHDVLIGRFVDAVLGRGPLPVSAEEALGVVRVVDRVVAELHQEAATR